MTNVNSLWLYLSCNFLFHSDRRFYYGVLQLQCVTHAEKCSVYLTQQQEIPVQFSFQISESDLKNL